MSERGPLEAKLNSSFTLETSPGTELSIRVTNDVRLGGVRVGVRSCVGIR